MKRAEFGAALLGLGALAVFGKRDALAASGYEVTHSDAQWMALLGPLDSLVVDG